MDFFEEWSIEQFIIIFCLLKIAFAFGSIFVDTFQEYLLNKLCQRLNSNQPVDKCGHFNKTKAQRFVYVVSTGIAFSFFLIIYFAVRSGERNWLNELLSTNVQEISKSEDSNDTALSFEALTCLFFVLLKTIHTCYNYFFLFQSTTRTVHFGSIMIDMADILTEIIIFFIMTPVGREIFDEDIRETFYQRLMNIQFFPNVIIGASIFYFSTILMHFHYQILAKIGSLYYEKHPKTDEDNDDGKTENDEVAPEKYYKLPQGMLFEQIVGAPEFCKLLQYLSFLVVCNFSFEFPGLWFIIWKEITYLYTKAHYQLRWYKKNLEEFPKTTRKLIPFII